MNGMAQPMGQTAYPGCFGLGHDWATSERKAWQNVGAEICMMKILAGQAQIGQKPKNGGQGQAKDQLGN